MAAHRSIPSSSRRRQAGFSLVEVSIVTAIVLIVSIIGIPAINSYVVENKVPRVAGELQRYATRTKANAQGVSNPYVGIDTGNLARAMRSSSILAVDAAQLSRVAHGLGGNGTSTGLIAITPEDNGARFVVTLDAVSDAACPGLASILQRVAGRIRVTGATGTVVKDELATPAVAYSPLAAERACSTGDTNTLAFTVW